MNLFKRFLPWLLAVVMLFGCIPSALAAETEIITAEASTRTDALPENTLLYSGYLEQLFYPNGGISFFGISAREQLLPLGQKLYDFLKTNLQAVSSGESSSTTFTLSAVQLSEWGGTTVFEIIDTQSSQEAASAALSSLKQEFEVDKVIDALLHDCPYELYWYDKVTGIAELATCGVSASTCSIQSLEFRFTVVADMRAENYSNKSPAFDTSNIAAATAAAANAQEIVNEFEDRSDYEKLLGYKNEICSLVTYDQAAASWGDFSEDADPWQLIYVFDKNTSTNVVCEGYAKAFQYLSDLSEFTSTDCITVSGKLSGVGHMWNIVTIDGQNYLTDITNCDTESTDRNTDLFLGGASGDISSGYVVAGLNFAYDNSMLVLWGFDESSRLNIATEKYHPCNAGHTEVIDPEIPATCDSSGLTEGSHCTTCGVIILAQQVISVSGHDYDITVVPPTCTEEGYTSYICNLCGDQYDDCVTEALEHTWLSATCTTPKTCSLCGATEGITLDHAYSCVYDTACDVCGYIRELNIVISPMYRLYNPHTHEHLLTSNLSEKDLLVSAGWRFDGIAWNTPSEGIPVYRLYNPYDDWHTYSMSQEEIDHLTFLGWKVDGIVACSAPTEYLPVYRLFNPYEQKNYHLLTASMEERNMLVKAGWLIDGVAWWAVNESHRHP